MKNAQMIFLIKIVCHSSNVEVIYSNESLLKFDLIFS